MRQLDECGESQTLISDDHTDEPSGTSSPDPWTAQTFYIAKMFFLVLQRSSIKWTFTVSH